MEALGEKMTTQNTPHDPAPHVDTEELIARSISKPTVFPMSEKTSKLPAAEKVKGGRPGWTYRKAWRNIMRTEGAERPWTEGPVTHRLMHPAYRPNKRQVEMLTINT